jgi:hypothetical protein
MHSAIIRRGVFLFLMLSMTGCASLDALFRAPAPNAHPLGLVAQAWAALGRGYHGTAQSLALEIIAAHTRRALTQQALLGDCADHAGIFEARELSGVAQAYFILGESRCAQGRVDDAREAYETVMTRFSCAQAWGPQVWTWNVAQGARERRAELIDRCFQRE